MAWHTWSQVSKRRPLSANNRSTFHHGSIKVEIGRVGGLEDELPAGMGQGKQQDIGGTMHIEIVQNRIDWLGLLWDPGVDTLQKSTQLAMVRPA